MQVKRGRRASGYRPGLAARPAIWQTTGMRKLFFAALFLMVGTATAVADGVLDSRISAADRKRLAAFDATFAEALAEAWAGGAAADKAVLEDVLAGKPLPLAEGFDATGSWRCRTLKAGGTLPLTVYPWFKCRISDDGAGWMLEKLTGSQRTRGFFYTLSGDRLAYLGAGYVAGETPRRYGDDAIQDQVAYAERRAPSRIILMFPAPHFESKLDILVLER